MSTALRDLLHTPLYTTPNTPCSPRNAEAVRLQRNVKPRGRCRDVHLGYSPPQTALQLLPQAYAAADPRDVHALLRCESLHAPTQHQVERYLPKARRHLQPASPSFLWAGIACFVNAEMDFCSWGDPHKEVQLCPVAMPITALPGSQAFLCKTQQTVPIQHIHLKYLESATKSALISAH